MITDVCQRWSRRRHSWRPVADGGFDRRRYDWSPLPEHLARGFVLAHHYAGSWPAAKLSVGMWHGEALVGVAVLGVPVRAEVLTGPFPDLMPYTESVELSRLVLLDDVPANGESWLLARLREHVRRTTAIRAVVSFSDPHERWVGDRLTKPGHVGVVYQAASGTVLNDRARAKLLAHHQGWRYVRDRLISLGAPPAIAPDAAWLAAALDAVGARREHHGGNHRYAFPLDPRVRIGLPQLPYPKAGWPR